MKRRSLLPLLAILACHGSAPVRGDAASATAFAQGFYDWYVPQGAHLESAIRDSAVIFAPALLGALREDLEAQAGESEEVVGLDWDPFLASQDPCPSYQVRRAEREGDDYLVDVFGICPGATRTLPPDTPDAIAQVARRGSSWVFVNFRYPADSSNLLTVLARLRAARDSNRVTDHR